ncbi:MAG: DUF6596 domain-containing protein [Cyanobacteria bacterium P01_C01_bin.118]
MDARRVAELAARNSYGRLVAYLAVRSQDISAAEDALGDAFLKALNTWPDKGVPDNPEAWLLVTAKRRLIDIARRSQTYTKLLNTLNLSGVKTPDSPEEISFSDERLKLLFICAHPAINVAIRTPLMLQTVMGLNAAQIGSAFLVAPTTMGQRLVRAKAKIRDARIPFRLPNSQELPDRLEAVLAAIYAAYTTGWDTVTGGDPRHKGLADEAIWLAQLCVQLLPEEPEARGLLALMLYCASRREARRSFTGDYVPLSEQDTALWAQPMIRQAECELNKASTCGKLGRFQLEAAIQSVHAQRAVTQQTDWEALAQLYTGLVHISPTIGARLGHAVAILETQGAQQSLELLDVIPSKAVQTYQPYWALRGHLLTQLGENVAAQQAYSRAIGLTEDAAIREFLMRKAKLVDL